MTGQGAPRLLFRLWRGLARGALPALALLATGAAAQDFSISRGSAKGCVHTDPPPFTGRVTASGAGIVSALYVEPTTAYGHGVLGDAIEAEAVHVRSSAGVCDTIRAGDGRVFEDTVPHIADVDGDGRNDVIVVASQMGQGARLEVWGYPSRGEGPEHDIRLMAATPYIGRSFRWLAVIGAADLDGDGAMEIAYVDRPHLAKTLRIWRWTGDGIDEVATRPGVTNHRIGEPFITGGIRQCGSRPEMVLATANWTRLLALAFDGSTVTEEDLGPFGAGLARLAMECR